MATQAISSQTQFEVPEKDQQRFKIAKKYLTDHPSHFYIFTGCIEISPSDERIYQVMKECLDPMVLTLTSVGPKENEYGCYNSVCWLTKKYNRSMGDLTKRHMQDQDLTKRMGIRPVERAISTSLFVFAMQKNKSK